MAGERVTVLGTGNMGGPMARYLLEAGCQVTVWNRSAEKTRSLAEAGARVAATPAEAVEGAAVIITMVSTGEVVASLIEQAASRLPAGAVWIDMSSTNPELARGHAGTLRGYGVDFLDAPVSGGTAGARAGTLAIMVGGEGGIFERVKDVLAALGRPTLVGPVGSGQLAKLCNQVIVAVTIGAVSEALLLAARGGADPAAVREALSGGFAESRILREHGTRILERNFEPGGTARYQLKDLDSALAAAGACDLDLPVTGLIRSLFAQLCESGRADLDHSALVLELERRNES